MCVFASVFYRNNAEEWSTDSKTERDRGKQTDQQRQRCKRGGGKGGEKGIKQEIIVSSVLNFVCPGYGQKLTEK